MEFDCSRRQTLKGIACVGLSCSITDSAIATTNTEGKQPVEKADETAWLTYDVSGQPFVIRYRDGYETAAQTVADLATTSENKHSNIYSYQIDSPFTFDLYPKEEWSSNPFNGSYSENTRSIRMMAPTDYSGDLSQEEQRLQFLHLVSHELAHVYQTEALKFHSHLRWPVEGFAEAMAVYYTDADIRERYTNRFDAATIRRRINHGYGFLMGVNSDKYRGSMHLLRFMIERYGGQDVFDIFDQTATSFVEAIEKQLDHSPHDLELEWLQYARRTFGGNYIDPILRLGGDIDASVAFDKGSPANNGSALIEDAIAQERFIVGLYNEGELVGQSQAFEPGQISNVEVKFDSIPDQLQTVTARLHATVNSDQLGEPITVDGKEILSRILYFTDQFGITFADQPTDGDAALKLNAYLDPTAKHFKELSDGTPYSGYSNTIMLKISKQSKSGYQYRKRLRVKAGNQLIRHEEPLDTGDSAIPLAEGDTIKLVIKSGQGSAEKRLATASTTVTTSQQSFSEPIGESSALPTDPDNDQLYEDVNGNGQFDIGDIQSLWVNRDSTVVRNNVSAFDFNNNGTFEIGDIQALFSKYLNW